MNEFQKLPPVDGEVSQLYPPMPIEKRSPLRVGIMLNRLEGEAWFGRILRDIVDGEYATIAVIILNGEEKVPALSWRENLLNGEIFTSTELYSRYSGFAVRRNRTESLAFNTVDFKYIVGDVSILELVPIRRKYVYRFSDTDVEAVEALDLDVIIRFGFNVIRGEIINAAKHAI